MWPLTGQGRFPVKLNRDALVAALVLGCVLLIFIPLPPLMLDIMVAVSLGSGFFLLAMVMGSRRIDHLLSFPALLLTFTILRLAVSVATSRAILDDGHAGEIIHAIGTFALGGNLVAGLVVFAIIAIVQFIVVTKGSERIAEVCARFALDAMPGRQMSIEADLKAGDIDKTVARQRREALADENRLLGAMDGALKFVKGDSIACMLLILVNLFGGLAIGLSKGMSMADATVRYSILSVGDGLVAQIPSILSATAAGLLVTNPGGEGKEGLGGRILTDIARSRAALILVAIALFALGVLPGFPHVLLLGLALGLAGTIGAVAWRNRKSPSPPADAADRTNARAGEDGDHDGHACRGLWRSAAAGDRGDPARDPARPRGLRRARGGRSGACG